MNALQLPNLIYSEMRMRVEMALLLLALLVGCLATTEVDNLNLLLPQLGDSSRALPLQLITAQGGCYSWASSAPAVLSATLLQGKGGCSKQAVVQVVRPGAYTSTAYITATDTTSESVLNIPVRIRRLHKIAIATKSRMMNLKEIQKIELFAHDADDNTFTSLEGLRFAWRLEQKTNIIESVPLVHAQLYLPLRTRENIEKEGFQSDILVVKALAPGNLKIIARCIEPGYEHLYDQITLSVHERFELKPGPILRMAASSSQQLFLQRPTGEIITLPQAYYNIRSCPGFEVNNTLYLTVGDATSRCQIRVEDIRTIPPYSSNITVILENPTEIRIISDPIIIVGQSSPFTVQLYNSVQELLYGTPKELQITSDFDINLGKRLIQADRKAVGFIRASLKQLRSQFEITALLPIRPLLPSNYLHLPVDETFKLRLVGGSGVFDYSTNNEVATVSSLGVIACKQPGEANITVTDRHHSANKVQIRLKVSSYASVRSLEQQKEVNRDEWGTFYLIGRNSAHQTFTQCLHSTFGLSLPAHKLEIDKKASFSDAIKFLSGHSSHLVQEALEATSLLKGKGSQIIQSFNSYVQANEIDRYDLSSYIYGLENYGICEIIRFRSLLSLQDAALIDLQGSETRIDTKVPLRVYEPVTTTIKDDAATFLLTPLSSVTWNYIGGSYAWPNSQTKTFINEREGTSKPTIICPSKETATTSYDLKVENEQTKFLLFPTAQRSQINVTCSFPKKLELSLDHGEVFDEIFIGPDAQLSGLVRPLDQNGNQFYNSSNVQYHHYAQTGKIQGRDTTFAYKPVKKSDKIKIYTQNLKERVNFRRVEAEFGITVVQPFKIDHLLYNTSDIEVPAVPGEEYKRKRYQIVTLFTPKKPYLLTLSNISPLLQIKCNQSVSCDRFDNRLSVNLLNIGRGWVSLKDKRVYGSAEWLFEFVIVEADEVVVAGERDSVPEGESVNVFVKNYYNGRLISPLLYQDNYLQLNIPRPLKVLQQSGNRFLVDANSVGRYEIHGQQGYPRTVRSKTPFILNVYERIEPDIVGTVAAKEGRVFVVEGTTTVVIGCRRILRVKGGPKDMTVSFENDGSLILKALPSNTFSIVGKRQGEFSLNFQAKVQQETLALIRLRVRVSVVQSVQLSSIDEPVIGAQFRILPIFKVGESEVEGCICEFDYKWSTSKQLLTLGSSNSLGFLSGGGINATAQKQGIETVSLTVEDKSTHKVIGQAHRVIKILKQISLDLPTIISRPLERTETLRIAPLTTYYFGNGYKIETKDDLLKISSELGLQASRKTGHSTIRLSKNGFRSEFVEVQVTHIAGILIENEDGSLAVQPNTAQKIPLHLYDNHGRLFVTPLHNLPISIASSNPDVLRVSISTCQKQIILEGVGIGASVLTVSVGDQYVYDAISVSVGSQILPAAEVRVLQGGTVRYSLPNNSAGKWQSSDSSVAKIDSTTGVATALTPGKTKITNGNVFGWLYVTTVQAVEQISYEQRSDGYQAVYRVLWKGKNTLEEPSSLFSQNSAINNNLKLSCHGSSQKWFDVKSQIRESDNSQRLVCNVRILGSPEHADFPNTYTLFIFHDSNELARFDYPSLSSKFTFDRNKRNIVLTSSEPRQTINIRTLNRVHVKAPSMSSQFVRTTFDSERSLQSVTIDMSGQKQNSNWQLELLGDNQTEVVRVSYKYTGGGEQHSFLSFSLDWPEYLIIFMAVVFGVLCFVQYYTEDKLKNS